MVTKSSVRYVEHMQDAEQAEQCCTARHTDADLPSELTGPYGVTVGHVGGSCLLARALQRSCQRDLRTALGHCSRSPLTPPTWSVLATGQVGFCKREQQRA